MRLGVEPVADNFTGTHFTTADYYSAGIPVITSESATTATADILYSYDVDAIDPDVGDTLE